MNRHIQLIKQFHQACAVNGALENTGHLSDMDIIMQQALLMEESGALFRAVKRGDMAEILAGLVNLSYAALSSLVLLSGEDKPITIEWKNDGSVLSLVKRVTEAVAQCSDGQAEHYLSLYYLCERLARDFLNADFDRAFQMSHASRMADLQESHARPSLHYKTPDLSDCLFE